MLLKGASALTKKNKDVMLELEMTRAKLEDSEHNAAEMKENIRSLSEEQKAREEEDRAPRANRALAKWGEVRKETVKNEEKDMMPLQALLDAALEEVEALKEAAANAEMEREEERQQLQERLEKFAESEKEMEKLKIDNHALEKSLVAQTEARTKLEERLAQERSERLEQVKALNEDISRLRPLAESQEQTIEQLRSQVSLLEKELLEVKAKAADARNAAKSAAKEAFRALDAIRPLLQMVDTRGQELLEEPGCQDDSVLEEVVYEDHAAEDGPSAEVIKKASAKLEHVLGHLQRQV